MEATGIFHKAMADWPVASIMLTVTVLLVSQFLIRLYRQRRFFRDLPGPPHSFLWGHLATMGSISALFPANCHPQAYYTEISRKYNLEGIFYLDLWPIAPSQVVLTDPSLLEEVSVKNPLAQHKLSDDFMAPVTGRNNIATSNGLVWKKLHKAMAPAFSWSHIRSVTGVMVEECQQFRKTLNEKAATGEVFCLEDLGSKVTFDIIARVVFNVRLHAQTTGSATLDDLRELTRMANASTDITLQFNPITSSKMWFDRQRVLRRLNPIIRKQIEERFDLLRGQGIVPSKKDTDSILDLMLREDLAKDMNSSSKLSEDDVQLLITNIKALLIGGQGTTVDSLCFIYMLLSKFPRVLQALRAEHSSVLGTSHQATVDSLVASPEKLQSLPYTEAVIKETLRLFPVGFGVRGAPLGATLSYGNRLFPIDRGLGVVLQGHDVHYNPVYFPDPTHFKPERWLENEIPKPYFRTFGRGLRGCLGQNLAMNMLKVILIMTARDFDFQCADLEANEQPRSIHSDLDLIFGDKVFQELGLEAKPRGGMKMTVKRART